LRLCFLRLGQSAGVSIQAAAFEAAPAARISLALFFCVWASHAVHLSMAALALRRVARILRGFFLFYYSHAVHSSMAHFAALVARILRSGFAFGLSRGAFIPHGRAGSNFEVVFFAFGPVTRCIIIQGSIRRAAARILSGSVFCVWASHGAFILAALALRRAHEFRVACFCLAVTWCIHPGQHLRSRQDARKLSGLFFAFGPVTRYSSRPHLRLRRAHEFEWLSVLHLASHAVHSPAAFQPRQGARI
jgi:hypothetical protein